MKEQYITQLLQKSIVELNTELESLLKSSLSLRVQISLSQSKRTSDIRKFRKNIARVRTVLKMKSK